MAINDTGGNLIVYPNQYENRLSSVHNDDRREKKLSPNIIQAFITLHRI